MLVLEGLTCRFGRKAAVDNASFSVAPGSFVGVIGRSGAGKSTLLRMINRLAPVSEGRIIYKDVDITGAHETTRGRCRVGPAGGFAHPRGQPAASREQQDCREQDEEDTKENLARHHFTTVQLWPSRKATSPPLRGSCLARVG